MTYDWPRYRRYLRARLAELGMKQVALATAAGVSPQTIRNLLGTGGHDDFKSIPESLETVDPIIGWAPGSGRALLHGGEPTLLSGNLDSASADADASAHAPAPVQRDSTLPVIVQVTLDGGPTIGADVIRFKDLDLVIVAKPGAYTSEEDISSLKEVMREWLRIQDGIRALAATPDETSDNQSGD